MNKMQPWLLILHTFDLNKSICCFTHKDTFATGGRATNHGGPQGDTLAGQMGANLVCEAVDVYLKALCERDALTPDLYHSIVAVVPGGFRISEDTFFQVVDSLLRSGELVGRGGGWVE